MLPNLRRKVLGPLLGKTEVIRIFFFWLFCHKYFLSKTLPDTKKFTEVLPMSLISYCTLVEDPTLSNWLLVGIRHLKYIVNLNLVPKLYPYSNGTSPLSWFRVTPICGYSHPTFLSSSSVLVSTTFFDVVHSGILVHPLTL